MINLRVATGFSGTRISAEIIAHALESGSYRKHLQILHQKLAHAMSHALTHLKSIGLTPWIEPSAGMFIWCEIPDGYSSEKLAQQAMQHKQIMLAPGNVFSPSHSADRFIRFNASQMEDKKIYDILEQLLNHYS